MAASGSSTSASDPTRWRRPVRAEQQATFRLLLVVLWTGVLAVWLLDLVGPTLGPHGGSLALRYGGWLMLQVLLPGTLLEARFDLSGWQQTAGEVATGWRPPGVAGAVGWSWTLGALLSLAASGLNLLLTTRPDGGIVLPWLVLVVLPIWAIRRRPVYTALAPVVDGRTLQAVIIVLILPALYLAATALTDVRLDPDGALRYRSAAATSEGFFQSAVVGTLAHHGLPAATPFVTTGGATQGLLNYHYAVHLMMAGASPWLPSESGAQLLIGQVLMPLTLTWWAALLLWGWIERTVGARRLGWIALGTALFWGGYLWPTLDPTIIRYGAQPWLSIPYRNPTLIGFALLIQALTLLLDGAEPVARRRVTVGLILIGLVLPFTKVFAIVLLDIGMALVAGFSWWRTRSQPERRPLSRRWIELTGWLAVAQLPFVIEQIWIGHRSFSGSPVLGLDTLRYTTSGLVALIYPQITTDLSLDTQGYAAAILRVWLRAGGSSVASMSGRALGLTLLGLVVLPALKLGPRLIGLAGWAAAWRRLDAWGRRLLALVAGLAVGATVLPELVAIHYEGNIGSNQLHQFLEIGNGLLSALALWLVVLAWPEWRRRLSNRSPVVRGLVGLAAVALLAGYLYQPARLSLAVTREADWITVPPDVLRAADLVHQGSRSADESVLNRLDNGDSLSLGAHLAAQPAVVSTGGDAFPEQSLADLSQLHLRGNLCRRFFDGLPTDSAEAGVRTYRVRWVWSDRPDWRPFPFLHERLRSSNGVLYEVQR